MRSRSALVLTTISQRPGLSPSHHAWSAMNFFSISCYAVHWNTCRAILDAKIKM